MRPKSELKKREVDWVEYLLERNRKGKFLYSNFQSIRNIGVSPYTKIKPIRPELGDYEHMASFGLRFFSFLYLSPIFAYEFYRLGKIMGYCTADGAFKTLRIKSLVSALVKTGLFWKVFQNERIQEALRKGWQRNGGALIKLIEINKEEKRLKYTMKENSCAIIKTLTDRYQYGYFTKPCNCIEMGILSGQAEALFGGLWDCIEIKCVAKGDSHCEMELYLHEEGIYSKISVLTKEEYGRILDMCIELVISKEKDTGRKEMGDLLTISASQSLNYLLLSISKGHVLLCKWAGRRVGERIMEKIGIDNLPAALEYTKNMFLDLRMGIMESELNPEIITIKMRESVYSSGVKNIHMKLCVFLGGIMEGVLNKATGTKWIVEETKCTANGDPYCEFQCQTEDPEVLSRILLGE